VRRSDAQVEGSTSAPVLRDFASSHISAASREEATSHNGLGLADSN
jgi:hypothetical protein